MLNRCPSFIVHRHSKSGYFAISSSRKSASSKSGPKAGPSSVKKKKKVSAATMSAMSAILTEVPTDIMSATEAEMFHSRLETAAKQLQLNRTQVGLISTFFLPSLIPALLFCFQPLKNS